MAPNDHLLQNYLISAETRALAGKLLREAQLKTGPGSGYELKEHTTGLVAICVLIASKRLNNNDQTEKDAQIASCLKPKDFKRVHEIVVAALGNADGGSTDSADYGHFHKNYKTILLQESLQQFLLLTEKELLKLGSGVEKNTKIFKCVVFFWVCNAAKPKNLPATDIFARENGIPLQKFSKAVELLNLRCSDLRTRIKGSIKRKTGSPTKDSPTKDSRPSTPTRLSPRKAILRELPTKDTPKQPVVAVIPQETPTRRSSRFQTTDQESPSKAFSSAQPSPTRAPWLRKGPIREAPSKDSPKKRRVEVEEGSDKMEVDQVLPETPTKRRRVDSPVKPAIVPPITHAIFPSTPSSSRILQTPKKPHLTPTRSSSPLKRNIKEFQNTTVVEEEMVPSSSDESDEEPRPIRRRFRPVYQDHKQWNARDPRLARIWKKAYLHQAALVDKYGHPFLADEDDRMEV